MTTSSNNTMTFPTPKKVRKNHRNTLNAPESLMLTLPSSRLHVLKLCRSTSRVNCLSRKVKVCDPGMRTTGQGHQQGLMAFASGTLHSDLPSTHPLWSGTNQSSSVGRAQRKAVGTMKGLCLSDACARATAQPIPLGCSHAQCRGAGTAFQHPRTSPPTPVRVSFQRNKHWQ